MHFNIIFPPPRVSSLEVSRIQIVSAERLLSPPRVLRVADFTVLDFIAVNVIFVIYVTALSVSELHSVER
jgi:hypothetical protein